MVYQSSAMNNVKFLSIRPHQKKSTRGPVGIGSCKYNITVGITVNMSNITLAPILAYYAL